VAPWRLALVVVMQYIGYPLKAGQLSVGHVR
jgi:hypothetical protein